MIITNFNNSEHFIEAALNEVKKTLANHPSPKIALSGGSTPQPFYLALANSDINLSKITFYQVDERYVPPDDPDSNYKLIKETLFSNSNNQPKNFFYFDTSKSLYDALNTYEKKLPPEGFDLIFLGIGPDGHTASLFPGLTALDETERNTAYTTTEEFAVFDRLTITFPLILSSKKIIVLLKAKENIIHELQEGPLDSSEFPAKRLLEHPNLQILQLL